MVAKPPASSKPYFSGSNAKCFALWCSMESAQRTKANLLKLLDDNYEHTVTERQLNGWMRKYDWVSRAEAEDKKVNAAVVAEINATKQEILIPMMAQLITAESLGWAKLVRAIEETSQESLSADVRNLKAFADMVMSMSKMRIVQEGGVSDRVGHEVKNMSDEELLAELDRLSAEVSGTAIQEDVYDLETDLQEFMKDD